MNSILKYFAAACSAAALPVMTAAQDMSDSLSVDRQFNALDYSMQKRHRPKGAEFVSERFWDNTFISGYVGGMQIARIPASTFSWGPVGGISIGKWFDEYNGLRISAAGNFFARNRDNRKPIDAGVDVSYLFNITSYLGGYSYTRLCDLYLLAGAGYRSTWLGRNKNTQDHAGNAHVGLTLNVRTGKHIDTFIESLAYIYSDGIAQVQDWNWRHYCFGYSLQAGLKFNVMPEGVQRPEVDYTKDTFVSFSGGMIFQNTPYIKAGGKVMASAGPVFTVSYGKWYSDVFGMRTSLLWSSHVWNSYQRYKLNSRYAGIRIEAMLDMISMFRERKEDPFFSFYTILGPEAGYFRKTDISRDIAYPYVALNGAFQFKFKLVDALSFFVEPRFTMVPYSYVNSMDSLDGLRHNYYDYLFSLNLGIEFALFH